MQGRIGARLGRKRRDKLAGGGREKIIQITVPKDLAVVQLNRNSEPRELAGIDQDLEAVGAAAVDLVVERLYHSEFGIPDRPKDVLIEGRWIEGTTVPGSRPVNQSTGSTR